MNDWVALKRQPIRSLQTSSPACRSRMMASDDGAEYEEDGDEMEKSETLKVEDEHQDEA